MQFRALLVASALLAASQSFAAVGDTCTPDVVDAQGNVTTDNFHEVCDGTKILACDDATSKVIAVNDCAALFSGAPVGTCKDFTDPEDSTKTFPRCAFNDGDACVFSSQSNPFIPFACATETSGCLGGVCVANVGACDGAAGGTSCLASGELSFCAPWAQQVGNNCAGWAQVDGATGVDSATCSNGVCAGVSEGGDCATGFYECASGLTCDGESQTSLGSCSSGATGGEGEGEGEAGSTTCPCGDAPPCDDASTCDDSNSSSSVCSNAGPSMPVFAGLALVLLGLARRRRA